MDNDNLVLHGISGSNPLGYLAAIGTVVVASNFNPSVRLSWNVTGWTWRPSIIGCQTTKDNFLIDLFDRLENLDMGVFELDKKLPYAIDRFRSHMCEQYMAVLPKSRRSVDFLAAFGSDVVRQKNDENIFESTAFRMTRRGDSGGKGFTAYAIEIHNAFKKDKECLRRALFEPWDYKGEGSNLRWDPIEDQRYALRWDDPSPAKKPTVLGANRLSIEALMILPTIPIGKALQTTGFSEIEGEGICFTWPIWKCELNVDSIRSVLALAELQRRKPNRDKLEQMGIKEIFRCRRIANGYYKNFLPAIPA